MRTNFCKDAHKMTSATHVNHMREDCSADRLAAASNADTANWLSCRHRLAAMAAAAASRRQTIIINDERTSARRGDERAHANDCDKRRVPQKGGQATQLNLSTCDHNKKKIMSKALCLLSALTLTSLLLAASQSQPLLLCAQSQSIIIDHHHKHLGAYNQRPLQSNSTKSSDQQQQQPVTRATLGANFQPASLLVAQNKSINFTHVALDELTGTIYLGATNWLFQVSGRDLRIEQALRTGPTTSDSSLARDCAPADCLNQLVQVDADALIPLLLQQQHPAIELSLTSGGAQVPPATAALISPKRFLSGATMHTTSGLNGSSNSHAGQRRLPQMQGGVAGPPVTTQLPTTTLTSSGGGGGGSGAQSSSSSSSQQQQLQHNNYNKILAIDHESRHLIVCGSLNQGACRRHQLGNLANFSELIPLPVASNDEHSSTLGLVINSQPSSVGARSQQQQQQVATSAAAKQPGVFYVAATNSRLGPYREMVPALSARSLDWSSRDRSMQIIERSFTDLARIDISFELRDYYLVNYVYAFQHNDFVYFATVQRKSPLRQLEEWGYETRLARLCLNDLSFQSYTEMTLECSAGGGGGGGGSASSLGASESTAANERESSSAASSHNQKRKRSVNYNLLQDAHLMQAGSQLQQQLGLSAKSSAVLVGAFSQSKDHTTRSQQKSALCLFPMDKIEQKFQENIDLCYNGTIKSRNMNYIAGSVSDCPKSSSSSSSTSSSSSSPGQTNGGGGATANYCNEPIKLNGSLALNAEPVASFEQELITAISSTLAPTSPVNMLVPQAADHNSASNHRQHQHQHQHQHHAQLGSIRQHQVLIAGTSDGRLKRLVLVAAGQRTTALEFDSVPLVPPTASGAMPSSSQASEQQTSAGVLADLHLIPASNPQLSSTRHSHVDRQQFALVATAHKLVKLRVNSCKASGVGNNRSRYQQQQQADGNTSNSSIVDDCLACSQLQDPFCGWCSNLASCTTRDECLQDAWTSSASPSTSSVKTTAPGSPAAAAALAIHWTPFDSIRCSNYQPISPKNVPIQADSSTTLVDVNVRLNFNRQAASAAHAQQLAARLAQAQFVCHFDYLSLWNRSSSSSSSSGSNNLPLVSGATTKAAQARLNLHAGTVAIGCPLPVASQRPSLLSGGDSMTTPDHARVRLSVRLSSVGVSSAAQRHFGQSSELNGDEHQEAYDDKAFLEQVLGMRSGQRGSASSNKIEQQQQQQQHVDAIERELTLYDCSLNSDCRSCLSSGSLGRRWSCAWCPLSSKCTFNSSHPDFGCAAGAVASTTPHSASIGGGGGGGGSGGDLVQIRGSHLTPSLDWAQASMLGITIDRLSQCPRTAAQSQVTSVPGAAGQAGMGSSSDDIVVNAPSGVDGQVPAAAANQRASSANSALVLEILVPHGARRSIQVPLARSIHQFQPREKRVLKLECLVELEGSKARFSARLLDNTNVICQESSFSYQAEVATQRATLSVVLNDNQVIETTEVILYKCHLFGVNPPALTSSIITANTPSMDGSSHAALGHHHHSSVTWASNLNEFFNLFSSAPMSGGGGSISSGAASTASSNGQQQRRSSDCSLCLNIDRKYQCSWCSGQCKHAEQCQELAASTCPPPRIDSIHPTSGPLEGGTLLTIEGSNLGSNEREIQDKITVGGEQCQLVMYSVSTRIVCRTGPSSTGFPQAATVFVGNRAGVTSAHEKFHYKAVHLTDVNPRIGPVSGGTRLFLSGLNLNIGSRIQVFLDDIPCQLDSTFEMTSNQIACVTGPILHASSSMRITRLTLMIDNSTHQLPYPFTYQPDPIITQIEPAESFVSGGRLILVSGQHLASPQSVKLVVFHESRPSLSNATACVKQKNDTLITCLTPAFTRADLLAVGSSMSQVLQSQEQEVEQQQTQQQVSIANRQRDSNNDILSHESGGLKLKMAFLMDDVKSVRNLDEYYHHLPHYITYYEDPQLFRVAPGGVVDYREELHLAGENLLLRQLEQDMQISIGVHICPIKSIQVDRVVCEPPARIAPIYEHQVDGTPLALNTNNRRRASLVERPLLPIVALIGSNLRYELGHMQYSSSQYKASLASAAGGDGAEELNQVIASSPNNYHNPQDVFMLDPLYNQHSLSVPSNGASTQQDRDDASSLSFTTMLVLGLLGLLVALLAAAFMFVVSRARQSKAQQREYKRIQLQMGSLDCQSPALSSSFAGGLFDKIYLPSMGLGGGGHNNNNNQQAISNQQQLFATANGHQHRALDYASQLTSGGVGGNGTKTKPLYQFFAGQPQVPSSFPPSPLTDISSLVSSPAHSHLQQQHQQQQNHVVKLSANGQVVNMTNQSQYIYGMGLPQPGASPSHPSSSSHSSTTSSGSSGGSNQNQRGGSGSNSNHHHQQQQQRQQRAHNNSSARNFSWTQEAPSTIVPYAVIEACNLTLEGKNAIKEYV